MQGTFGLGIGMLTARLQLLSELTREFARSTGDYHRLLDLVARRLGEVLGDSCLIRLLPPDGDYFDTVEGLYHPDASFVPLLREYMRALPQRFDAGLTRQVLASGQSMLVPATSPDQIALSAPPRFRALIDRLAIRSLMAAPLRSEGKPIGVA